VLTVKSSNIISHNRMHTIKTAHASNVYNSVALVRERTIPTERSQLVGEVSANFSYRGVSHDQRGGSLGHYLDFLDRLVTHVA
jgi:hypothetical protein